MFSSSSKGGNTPGMQYNWLPVPGRLNAITGCLCSGDGSGDGPSKQQNEASEASLCWVPGLGQIAPKTQLAENREQEAPGSQNPAQEARIQPRRPQDAGIQPKRPESSPGAPKKPESSYGITQITIQMAQIYSQKLWNHVNYYNNGANL